MSVIVGYLQQIADEIKKRTGVELAVNAQAPRFWHDDGRSAFALPAMSWQLEFITRTNMDYFRELSFTNSLEPEGVADFIILAAKFVTYTWGFVCNQDDDFSKKRVHSFILGLVFLAFVGNYVGNPNVLFELKNFWNIFIAPEIHNARRMAHLKWLEKLLRFEDFFTPVNQWMEAAYLSPTVSGPAYLPTSSAIITERSYQPGASLPEIKDNNDFLWDFEGDNSRILPVALDRSRGHDSGWFVPLSDGTIWYLAGWGWMV